jgi:IS605 OrfB family transposase
MAKAIELPTTQRAYTLRLRGNTPQDCTWRDALWATHEAVNKGAKVFGDWLLTVRGGIDHSLADGPIKQKGDTTRSPTPQERRDRRILLALSWLTVEDALGAPSDEALIVARGTDNPEARMQKLVAALDAILTARGVTATERGDPKRLAADQRGTWLGDCIPSLAAAIRDDAVWVNRSKAYDHVQEQLAMSRDEIWDFLEPFFSGVDAYLAVSQSETAQDDVPATNPPEKAKDLCQKAGGWLSKRFGTGTGANFRQMANVYSAICTWAGQHKAFDAGLRAIESLAQSLNSFSPAPYDAKGILKLISGPGYKSATQNIIAAWAEFEGPITAEAIARLGENAGNDRHKCITKSDGKGKRIYSDTILNTVETACGFTYLQDHGPARHREFSVILDHAARRVNVVHSWIKNAEAERRAFENDSTRITQVPEPALLWLRNYCDTRGNISGALDSYRLRRRAIDAWDKVVERWSHSGCQSKEDRIAEARQLQDDPSIDKFGDIQLFEALADDDAFCIWNLPEGPNPQPLKDFVAATEADDKKRRFKVPAYRHPDALRNPVFVDFGNSRWHIDYSAHRRPVKSSQLREHLAVHNATVCEIREKMLRATEGRKASLMKRLEDAVAQQRECEQAVTELDDHYRVIMKLWTGQAVATVPMHWSCKRLTADLAIRNRPAVSSDQPDGVSRADRLGRAANHVGPEDSVTILGLFEQADWNGRLQAPRDQLDRIARHVDKHGWDAKAARLVGRLKWLVSFSAKLTQQGPWTKYCQLFDEDCQSLPFISRKGDCAVKHDTNDSRHGQARLILSRLPALRVLAVDLGHRYAAACAVWEAITTTQLQSECQSAGVKPPDSLAMSIHLKRTTAQGKTTTTVFRRIGSDQLPNGDPHPAPWARLDRQFLIKLQGESRSARAASVEEMHRVEEFETWTGLQRDQTTPPRTRAVDHLMNQTVRNARLALARHGRRSRIAFQLLSNVRILPGGRRQALSDVGEFDLLLDTLLEWHALATDARWSDSPARQLWNSSIATLDGGFAVAAVSSIDRTLGERRHEEEVLRRQLAPLAAQLQTNRDLRHKLHASWSERWTSDDQQWRRYLRWLARWLLPRGGSRQDGGRRHVGGLSLGRISTLTEFRRKVQVAYFTRLKPDGKCAEIGRFFGQSTLDAIQRLKDQRVKQLASRIVEAALGIGCEKKSANGRDLPRQASVGAAPRFAPCHAIVIEDLSHYRPEETRTRRENRNTMDWKSAETRKRLSDHCQLYGLCLRDVAPHYTSRQDSRTGAPGLRCVDVPVADFLSQPWWRKQVLLAQKRAVANQGDARDRYLLSLEQRWAGASEVDCAKAGALRIPMNGGELFVSADAQSPLAKGIQADLNAAANIGLRALTDPDFPGKWWYVPCDATTKEPHPEKVKGSILAGIGPLAPCDPKAAESGQSMRRKRSSKEKSIVNLWRDPHAGPIEGAAGLEVWTVTPAYWNLVKVRVIENLSKSVNGEPGELSGR